MQQQEEQVAAGGALYRRAGCLLVPFIPIKAAGALLVTTHRIVFEPILHWKLVARKLSIELEEVERAEATGSHMELSLTDLVSIGKALTIRLKNGSEYTFRSVEADQLAEAINQVVRRLRR